MNKLYSLYYWTGNGFALETSDETNGAPSARRVNNALAGHYQAGAILLIQLTCETYIGDRLVLKARGGSNEFGRLKRRHSLPR